MTRNLLRFVTTFLVAIILLACSAGGGETGTGFNDESVSVGVITAFGSVYVNGVKYETNNSTDVTIDGESAMESQLGVGMLVTVRGKVNTDGVTGAASNIIFEDDIEGLVFANNITTDHSLNVMGQTVITDIDTVFESQVVAITRLEEIVENNIVEVSGFTSGDGTIFASRVEVKRQLYNAGEPIEIKGMASNVGGSEFNIGNLTIMYSDQTTLRDFSGKQFIDGMLVEVKSQQALDAQGKLIASSIELKDDIKNFALASQAKEIEFEGIVTQQELSGQFSLNGREITITSSTEFKGGDIAAIKVGVKIKMEGVLGIDGNIVAKELKFEQQSKTKLEGVITEINPNKQTITVLGQEVYINNTTRVKDDLDEVSDSERRFFHFSNLRIGNFVEISAYLDTATQQLTASKLERDDDEGESAELEIKGIITSIDLTRNIIVVSGVDIDISAINNFTGKLGNEIEAKGRLVANVWVASELSVEDGENDEGKDNNSDDGNDEVKDKSNNDDGNEDDDND